MSIKTINKDKRRPHALLMPLPFQGHIIPAVHTAIKLASKGMTITFVNTEDNHHRISSASKATGDIFADARATGLDIRYEVVGDGLPVDFDRSLHQDEFVESYRVNVPTNVEALVKRLIADGALFTCFIVDTFFDWPAAMAKKFGVPYVSFWTESALVLTLYYHVYLLEQNGHFGSQNGNRTDMITYIPGVDEIAPSDLMSYLQDTDRIKPSIMNQVIFKTLDEVRNADFILCNTIEELESKTIQAFQLIKPIYAVGPIVPQGSIKSKIPTSLWTESDCTQWLNSKPASSVLYISFGSYAHVSKEELEEIAYGVMDSEVSFLWVIRPDIVSSDVPDPLPNEFLKKTKGRGIVVAWCNQVEVLSHESVGGFLTHCGWNSILESVRCGVPLLCYPLLTDQFTNRKLVVQDWRVGIDLGGSTTIVKMNDVSEKIGRLMSGKEGNEMKKRVKELKKTFESVISPNGSSVKNFDRLVKDLSDFNAEKRSEKIREFRAYYNK